MTVESGARALLYSGKESESTGVQTEVGGESNTRLSTDSNTDLATVSPAIDATGKYALFRIADDTSFSSIALGAGTLSPSLDSSTTSYYVTLPSGTSSFSFTPTLSDSSATMTIGGVSHTSGSEYTDSSLSMPKVYTVVVTASDGVTQETYTIKVSDDEVSVSDVSVDEGDGYAVFTVTGAPYLGVALSTSDDTAEKGGVDYGNAIEVSTDGGTTWTTYQDVVSFPVSGELKVRVAIVDDSVSESSEKFNLVVKVLTSGVSADIVYDVDYESIDLDNLTQIADPNGYVGDTYKQTNTITIDS